MASGGDVNVTEKDLKTQVEQLRDMFMTEYNESIAGGLYDARDVNEVATNDTYVQCFVKSFSDNNGSLTKACHNLDTVLKFRKEMGVRDLTEECCPKELIDRKIMYWNGVDKHGSKILMFKVARHEKGKYLHESRAYISYLLEQHHQNNLGGARIVLIFDFTDAGVSNMDLDVTRFIITCLSTYFPGILAYILLYEMPWLLSSIWKVIRSWLTEEQRKRITLAKRADLPTYIDSSELEPHMQPITAQAS